MIFMNEKKLNETDADLIIKHLYRMQLGYSALIAYGLEEGLNENEILADIESMVRSCIADGNISMINNGMYPDTEKYIKETSDLIFMQLKKRNNY